MKDICVWTVCLCTAVFGSCYVYQIWRRKAVPTTSTWVIFLVGCGLSFTTYIIAENKDLKSGIMNTVDVAYVTLILAAIFLWTGHEMRFKPFEKWYLAAAGLILAYGIVTGDAWNSNILTQILMGIAYLPMWQKLLSEKRKTDSYFAWVPTIFTGAISLYPAIYEGNALAVIYSARAFFCTLATTLLMLYYQIKSNRTASAA